MDAEVQVAAVRRIAPHVRREWRVVGEYRERGADLPADRRLYSYGLHSYGLYSYDLYSYGLHSYGPYSYGIYSYGLYSYGPM